MSTILELDVHQAVNISKKVNKLSHILSPQISEYVNIRRILIGLCLNKESCE